MLHSGHCRSGRGNVGVVREVVIWFWVRGWLRNHIVRRGEGWLCSVVWRTRGSLGVVDWSGGGCGCICRYSRGRHIPRTAGGALRRIVQLGRCRIWCGWLFLQGNFIEGYGGWWRVG